MRPFLKNSAAAAGAALCALSISASEGAPAPRPAAGGATACTFLSKDEIRPFIRNRVFDQFPAEEEQLRTGSMCTYAGVIIQLDPFPISVIESAWSKEKGNFEAIPGLGDAAYFHRNTRAEAAEIAVRVGQRVFTAHVDLDTGEPMDSGRTRAIGLARVAAAKLR